MSDRESTRSSLARAFSYQNQLGMNKVGQMTTERRCSLYRSSGTPDMGRGCGYCEFDGTHAICHGEMNHCEKLDALRRSLLERRWMKIGKTDNQ